MSTSQSSRKGFIYCHGELSSGRHVCSLGFGTLIQQGNVDFSACFTCFRWLELTEVL